MNLPFITVDSKRGWEIYCRSVKNLNLYGTAEAGTLTLVLLLRNCFASARISVYDRSFTLD
jgi:hypothetical protein